MSVDYTLAVLRTIQDELRQITAQQRRVLLEEMRAKPAYDRETRVSRYDDDAWLQSES